MSKAKRIAQANSRARFVLGDDAYNVWIGPMILAAVARRLGGRR